MDSPDPRAELDALIREGGTSYAALSRMLGRNPAYLQQYVRRGTPRILAEADRKMLSRFFGVAQARLGGEVEAERSVPILAIDVAAAGGAGGLLADEARATERQMDAGLLRMLGVRPGDAAFIHVVGDSMAPTLEPGDEILVDRGERTVRRRGGLFVLRLDGMLMVKRLASIEGRIAVTSDNPAFPAIPPQSPASVEVIGRVAWLGRVPG